MQEMKFLFLSSKDASVETNMLDYPHVSPGSGDGWTCWLLIIVRTTARKKHSALQASAGMGQHTRSSFAL